MGCYADYDYYVNTYGGTALSVEEAPRALLDASETVDSLTYCRIVSCGLDGLTDFQRGIVQRVVCKLAEWKKENAGMIDSSYTSYSINGVTANFGDSPGVSTFNGVKIPRSIYAELIKTGLCYSGV